MASFRDSRRGTSNSELSRSSHGVLASQRGGSAPALPTDGVPEAFIARGLAAQRGLWAVSPESAATLAWALSAAGVVPPRAAARRRDCIAAARGMRRGKEVMARDLQQVGIIRGLVHRRSATC
jgi:hypothetical protein